MQIEAPTGHRVVKQVVNSMLRAMLDSERSTCDPSSRADDCSAHGRVTPRVDASAQRHRQKHMPARRKDENVAQIVSRIVSGLNISRLLPVVNSMGQVPTGRGNTGSNRQQENHSI
jgi:hypothetical protein